MSARVLRIAISLLFGISCGGTNARFTAPISDASPDSVLASDGSVEDAASSDGAAKPADAFADSGVLVAADADASTGCSYSWRDGGPDATQSDNASVFLVATNPTTPAYLAVDDTTVYWTDSWDRVMKAPLTGREAFVVAGTGTPSPAAIAVDATYVYWASTGGRRILRCPKDDCNCTPFVVAAPLGDITEIALGAGEVYTSDPNGGRILACATSGCRNHPRVVYSGSAPSQLAVHDGNIYFFDAPQMPGQPVQAPRILKCPVNGCGNAPTVLASVGARTALAVDSNNVYWVAVPPPGGGLSVVKCAVGGCGGTPDVVLPGGVADISQLTIATDGVRVYFNGSGRVLACPVGGCAGAPTVIFGGLQYPGAIAVGATKVVVIDEGTHRIWAIPK